MLDAVTVYWGDREFKATWESYEVTGIRIGKSGVIERPLALQIKGQSAHEKGAADVSINIRMSSKAVLDLFDAVLEFRARDNPALKRVGKALLKSCIPSRVAKRPKATNSRVKPLHGRAHVPSYARPCGCGLFPD